MPQPAGGEEAIAHRLSCRHALAAIARLLTIGRLVLVPPFLWILVEAVRDPSPAVRGYLAGVYLGAVGSDFLDGRLARAARAADRRWGVVDVVADATFNFSSLAFAAALGLIGPWVPAAAGVLVLRYLLRLWTHVADSSAEPLPRDRLGNAAGVLYYALVGLVVARVVLGVPRSSVLGWMADAVFLYSVFVFWSGASRRPNSSA